MKKRCFLMSGFLAVAFFVSMQATTPTPSQSSPCRGLMSAMASLPTTAFLNTAPNDAILEAAVMRYLKGGWFGFLSGTKFSAAGGAHLKDCFETMANDASCMQALMSAANSIEIAYTKRANRLVEHIQKMQSKKAEAKTRITQTAQPISSDTLNNAWRNMMIFNTAVGTVQNGVWLNNFVKSKI